MLQIIGERGKQNVSQTIQISGICCSPLVDANKTEESLKKIGTADVSAWLGNNVVAENFLKVSKPKYFDDEAIVYRVKENGKRYLVKVYRYDSVCPIISIHD